MSDRVKVFLGVLGGILLAGGIIYFLNKRSDIPGTPGYTIEGVPSESVVVSAPDYTKAPRFSPGISEEVKRTVALNLAELTGRLKKSTLDFDAWMSLGAVYKVAGDYAAARDAWEYAGVLSPTNYPSFANLGDLYHNYLKDYPKAEANYRHAISNERAFIGGYRALYELYAFSYAAKASEAPKVLLEGISANPGATELHLLLGRYYRDRGDLANAGKYYESAIAAAKKAGNTELAGAIQKEYDSFK